MEVGSIGSAKWRKDSAKGLASAAMVAHFFSIRRSNWNHNCGSVSAKLGFELEIGMRSICPTSNMFDKKEGTAEEQLTRMIDAADTVGSHIVRAVWEVWKTRSQMVEV